MPAPSDDALRSPDGRSWWDGTAWQPVEVGPPSIPQGAVRSPDGTEWWDGTAWRTLEPPPPPAAPPAQDLCGVTWVYGTFDITSDAVTVHQRKSAPFSKARANVVYPLDNISTAEVYGSNLTLRLRDRDAPRGIQQVAQPELVAATLRAFGVASTYTEAADAPSTDAGVSRVGQLRVKMTESEKYFQRKNAAHRKRKIARAVGTQACCGIPCLVSLVLVLATVLLALTRL